VEVWGIGGEHLRAAGMQILVDTASVATMGLVETFGTIGRLLQAYRRLVRFLDEQRPNLVVLIDYPEFNLLLARQAKRRGIPVFYFIGPQVWAWRRGRVRKIQRRVDKMALVFPFEPQLYDNGRQMAVFVGHPLLDVVRPTRSREESRRQYGLDPDRPTLALLPGSREKEIGYLLRPLCDAAERLSADGWQAILALASGVRTADLTAALDGAPLPIAFAEGDTYNVIAAVDAAVVTSGTATLETALLGCPMVIVYRMAPLTYWLARRLVHVDWIGMPNIILQDGVFPELIQEDVTAEGIAEAVRGLMRRRDEVQAALRTLRERLGEPGAADRAAGLAVELIEAT
jgi:lipid-A-disaccharide synthase